MFSDTLIEKLNSASNVVALTGAGASAESGIPTFRDPDGIWKQFQPGELASMEGFRRDPIRVQAWYTARRETVLEAEPNAGHFALARLEQRVPNFTLISQNVDGLHARAGSVCLLELHGSLLDSICSECGKDSEPFDVAVDAEQPAKCECGGLLRPTVVWFGEMLNPSILERAWSAAAEADVFLSIGTGAEVHPAASLPLVAADNGAYVAEINPRRTAITGIVNEEVSAPAGIALPAIVNALTAPVT